MIYGLSLHNLKLLKMTPCILNIFFLQPPAVYKEVGFS